MFVATLGQTPRKRLKEPRTHAPLFTPGAQSRRKPAHTNSHTHLVVKRLPPRCLCTCTVPGTVQYSTRHNIGILVSLAGEVVRASCALM